nr:unnamed protein product [Callosobruchus analis]
MSKLFNIYIDQCTTEFKTTKFDMFTNSFINEYNIGFSSPATRCCAQCMRLKDLTKKEHDEDAKKQYNLELTMHKMFGRLEKDIRKHPVLSSKKDYEAIYEEHCNIRSLDSDNGWKIFSIKALEEKLKKIQGIADMKVIKLKKLVCICMFRTGGEKYTRLIKPNTRGLLQTDLKERAACQRGISEKNKKSLGNLLAQQVGQNWRNDKDLA